jgi:hypothetical protein
MTDIELRVAILESQVERLSCNYDKMETMISRLNHLADRAEAALDTITLMSKVTGFVVMAAIGVVGIIVAYYAI